MGFAVVFPSAPTCFGSKARSFLGGASATSRLLLARRTAESPPTPTYLRLQVRMVEGHQVWWSS
eukprot:scaffold135294_cov37-Prasinocladus_malaysianus.AAC.1